MVVYDWDISCFSLELQDTILIWFGCSSHHPHRSIHGSWSAYSKLYPPKVWSLFETNIKIPWDLGTLRKVVYLTRIFDFQVHVLQYNDLGLQEVWSSFVQRGAVTLWKLLCNVTIKYYSIRPQPQRFDMFAFSLVCWRTCTADVWFRNENRRPRWQHDLPRMRCGIPIFDFNYILIKIIWIHY